MHTPAQIFAATRALEDCKDDKPPVVVTGLGREPAAVIRQGSLEIEILDPNQVEASWLASVLRATRGSEF